MEGLLVLPSRPYSYPSTASKNPAWISPLSSAVAVLPSRRFLLPFPLDIKSPGERKLSLSYPPGPNSCPSTTTSKATKPNHRQWRLLLRHLHRSALLCSAMRSDCFKWPVAIEANYVQSGRLGVQHRCCGPSSSSPRLWSRTYHSATLSFQCQSSRIGSPRLVACDLGADRGIGSSAGAAAGVRATDNPAAMANGASPRLLIVSDLDNTMVDHQDTENTSLLRFGSLWEASYRHDSMLVFSTGRSPILYQKLRTEVPLLTPDIAITSVGTEIVYGDTLEADAGWTEELNQGWDRNAVVEEANKLALKFQDESEQRPHKLSFHVEKAKAIQIVEDLSEKLKARGVNAKLIYSGGLDLDILPQGAGKGQALAYLLKKFKAESRSPVNTLVCGDSGNDAELFAVADVHGVMVGNAMEELIQWHEKHAKDNAKVFRATERCAAGIIQAMQHFKFIPNVSPRDLSWQELSKKDKLLEDETSRVACEIVEYQVYLEKWLRGQVDNSDSGFWRLKYTIDEKSSMVFAHGTEGNAFLSIDSAKGSHGAVPHFVGWVDRVRIRKLSQGVWSVLFDKWERSGPADEPKCRISSALLVSQDGTPNGLKWVHVQETWLEGYAGKLSG